MFKVEMKGMDKLLKDLETMRKTAVPYAARNALNTAAFEARKLWQGEIRRAFTTRNTWTERTIIVEKARGTDLGRMQSVVGSTEEYMRKQEFGGMSRGSVPTSVASGEGRGHPPRKKLVKAGNKLARIALGQRYRRGERKQRNAVALHLAAKTGKKFVFLDLGRRKGVFKLGGPKRNPRIDMLWDTTSKVHTVRATPTLQPALRKLERKLPSIMTSAVIEQMKRHRIFGY